MNKVRDGYKMSEFGEIPSDWEIKSINDICNVNPDTLSNKSDKSLPIEYIDIESVTTGKINEIKKLEFKEAPSRARRLIKRNDVIMSTVRPYLKAFTKVNIEKDNLVCSTGFAVLRTKKNINHEFLFQSILSDYYIQQLSNKMVGSNYPAVNSSDVKESNIILPSLEEQEKIASILSTVDEQIDNVEALIEKNKELKKGLMQTLLTKGIGHTKFKKTEIGEIPEEWKVITLGNISRNKGEYGIGASASKFIEGKPRYLRITDIGDGCSLLFNDIKGLNDSEYEKYLLSIGDVVFARTGNTTGKAYVYEDKHGELVYAGFLIKFSINLDKCMPNFIKYVIQTKRYWDWVQIMSTRSGQPGINSNEYSGFLVQIPSIGEQEKIASILSEIDEKIEEYENKKQKLEELKKGLMQQLLTGIIRV